MRGRIWISTKSLRIVNSPFDRNEDPLEKEVVLWAIPLKQWRGLSNLENEVYPQSTTWRINQGIRFPSPKHVVSPHIQDPISLRESRSDSSQIRAPTPLREGERESLVTQTNEEGLRIQKSK